MESKYHYFKRDISWLSFNYRVLLEADDNEKLIFKILKRGEKLNIETAETENDLADGGLRYDLTLPLSRYYSNNSANLPSPLRHFR